MDGPACALGKAFSVCGRIKHVTLSKHETELQALHSEEKHNSSQQPTSSMIQSCTPVTCSYFPFLNHSSLELLKSEGLLLKGTQSH